MGFYNNKKLSGIEGVARVGPMFRALNSKTGLKTGSSDPPWGDLTFFSYGHIEQGPYSSMFRVGCNW